MKKNKKKLGIIAGVILVLLLVAAIFPFVLPWPYKSVDPTFTNTRPDFNISSMFLKYNFGDGVNTYDNLSVIGTRGFALKKYKVANMYFGLPVTSIAPNAFKDNTNLESIYLPENIRYISDNAFNGCSSLEEISVPESLITISSTAFDNCEKLQYNEYENALYLGNDNNPYIALIKIINTGATSLTLHSGTSVIADSALADCFKLQSITFEGNKIPVYSYKEIVSLTSVVIKGDVTEIQGGAFSGCANLKEVILPDTVKVISNTAFNGCGALTSIELPESLVTIGNNAFTGCGKLSSINLPASLESIGDYAFSGCVSLDNVIIPSSVTEIKNYTFQGCTSLKNVVISDSVTKIGTSAFAGCKAIEEIELPTSLTNVGASAFSQCSSLASIDIPDSVTVIGDYAFEGTAIVSVEISKYVTKLGSAPFHSCLNLTEITVDVENEKYQSIDGNLYSKDGKMFIQYVAGKDNVPFYVPDTVETIGDSAFRGCVNLMNVVIPESVKTIKNSVFFGCSKSANIYCESITQPAGWDKAWNPAKVPVFWGYVEK